VISVLNKILEHGKNPSVSCYTIPLQKDFVTKCIDSVINPYNCFQINNFMALSLPEKLAVAQLVKKFSFTGNERFVTVFARDPILNPDQT
jgi:hypothetical protein